MFNTLRTKILPLLAIALLTPSLAVAANQPLDRIAVIVNDDIIMQSQVQQAINSAIGKLQQSNQAMPPKKAIISQVVEGLIMESLQLQIADRGGIRVDDTSLNEAVQRIAAQNDMTIEQFQQAISKEGSSYTVVREQIRRELITTRARQGSVGPRIQITDQEIQNYLSSAEGEQLLKSKYHIGHILIKPASNSAADKQQAQEQVQDLYQQLQSGSDFNELARNHSADSSANKGGDMGWRDGSQLPSLFKEAVQALKTGETAQPIASSNGFHLVNLIEKRGGSSIIQNQTLVRHILVQPTEIRSEDQAEELIYELFTRIQSGEDFSEMARLYSGDPGSRAKGGELGWITPAGLVPAFVKVMKETPENTVSGPFKSRYGWHILEVQGQRQEDIGAEANRQKAREILYKRKFNDELELWLREIRDNAFVDVKI
ncbi:MAG: peptidylprolyl isomerase [Pseudomonadales bacterium]